MTTVTLDDSIQEFTIKSSFIPIAQQFIERCVTAGATLENISCTINDFKDNY